MEWSVYKINQNNTFDQIDSVFFNDTCDAEWLLNALIDHDGYDSSIQVQPVEPDAWPRPLGLAEIKELQQDGELYENWVDKAHKYLPETGHEIVNKWKKQIGIPV